MHVTRMTHTASVLYSAAHMLFYINSRCKQALQFSDDHTKQSAVSYYKTVMFSKTICLSPYVSPAIRLRYSRNGNLTIAGFSEPDQCEQEDLAPWLPFPPDPADTKCLDAETSRYILEKVGDQFCQLVGQEEEAKSWDPANGQSKLQL